MTLWLLGKKEQELCGSSTLLVDATLSTSLLPSAPLVKLEITGGFPAVIPGVSAVLGQQVEL